MDTATTGRGWLPRLLSRVLFVLGGAVAVTAVGWLLSSATASADTLPVTPPPAVGASVLGSASDALTAVGVPPGSGDMPAVPTAPSALPLPGADGVRNVAGAIGHAVRQLGDHVPVDRTVVVAPLTGLPSTPATKSTPTGQSGPAGGQTSARTLPVRAALTTAPAPSGPVVAQRSVVRPPAGLAFPTRPKPPVRPSSPTPWTPVSVPAAPSGGTGATGPGGLGLVDQSGTLPVPDLDVVRVVPVTAPLGQVPSGRQPGITPD